MAAPRYYVDTFVCLRVQAEHGEIHPYKVIGSGQLPSGEWVYQLKDQQGALLRATCVDSELVLAAEAIDIAYRYYESQLAQLQQLSDPYVPPETSTVTFPFYDATYFQNKPNLTGYGFRPVFLTDRLFFAGTEGNYDQTRGDETRTRALARQVAALDQILILDIEHWPVDIRNATEAEVIESIGKLGEIVDWLHDEVPTLRVGYYGLMPIRDYWSPVQYLEAQEHQGEPWYDGNMPQFRANYQAWQRANDFLAPLVQKVDILFPSLYTFYEDTTGWVKYATANIQEARRYGNRPIMPFIWMYYHDSTPLRGMQLAAGYWRLELETIMANADGVVVWGGSSQSIWDNSAPWWTTLLDVMGY